MTGHASDDRLLDLAAGLAAHDHAETLLAHLRGCAPCEERFREVCRELERGKLRPAQAPVRRRFVVAGAVAALAAAIVAAALLVPWRRGPVAADPVAYWMPVEAEPVDLRAGLPGEDASTFAEATDAYRRRDAGRVVELLDGKAIPSSHDPLKLLHASALLKTGDAAGALAVLESLQVESLPPPYRDRAKWVQLGALRARGDHDAAARLAEEIAARPGEFSEAARALQLGSPSRKNPAQ